MWSHSALFKIPIYTSLAQDLKVVKCPAPEKAMKAQKGSRGIALLFL
jgi:hypothetical protein